VPYQEGEKGCWVFPFLLIAHRERVVNRAGMLAMLFHVTMET